jgi:glutamine cyclotransferase
VAHLVRVGRVGLAGLAATVMVMFATRAPGFMPSTQPAPADLPMYGYQIVQVYPHDPKAFTQGLQLDDGALYEGTGQVG